MSSIDPPARPNRRAGLVALGAGCALVGGILLIGFPGRGPDVGRVAELAPAPLGGVEDRPAPGPRFAPRAGEAGPESSGASVSRNASAVSGGQVEGRPAGGKGAGESEAREPEPGGGSFGREVQELRERLAPGGSLSHAQLLEALAPLMKKLVAEDRKAAVRAMSVWLRSAGQAERTPRSHAETAAMATLRNLASSQAQLQASAAIDLDGDGAGEYGYLAEQSGAVELRGGSAALNPPVLSAAFRKLRAGRVTRSGYHFAVFLPDAFGVGYPEQNEGGAPPAVAARAAADLCEVCWCAYAWPVEESDPPRRAFFVSQAGDVLACANKLAGGGCVYFGERGPQAPAAFAIGGTWGLISGKVAANAVGQDGERWTVVR